MSKILLYSDIHIAQHKKSIDRLHDCLKALNWVFDVAEENNIKDIVFGGDLFQDRQKIDVITYHFTFDVLSKRCNGKINLWLLLGNHDLWYHDKWDISSVKPLSAIKNVHVIEEPCTLEIAGNYIDFLPYTHKPIEYLNTLRKERKGRKTLVAHLAVDGAQLNTLHNTRADVIIEHDGEMVKVDINHFEGWDQVWLGHYHGYQKLAPNIEYIGSTLQLSFGEAFQHKYVIINDLETGEKKYIKNKFSPQHLIIPESDIDKYDIENNFIRLTVDDIGHSGITEVRKEVSSLKPGSLEIIPVEREETEHLIEDAKAILYKEDEMLEKYVEQVEVSGLDKKILLEIGQKICLALLDKY
jgi:DNA repair exonuclease SbcCD nuclease subunit